MHSMFDPERRCMPVDEWPEADRSAWAIASGPFNPLEPTEGMASRWAQATRLKTELGYGRWLGWLDRAGALDPISSPAQRATRETVRAYLKMLGEFDYAPYTVAGRLQELADALRVMAPDIDWIWLQRAAGRLHEAARPVTDLNDRIRSAEEVAQLGFDLMHHAEHDRFRTSYDRAVMYRDGLVLAGLIHRPLRIGNFASIAIGRHLKRRGDHWWLTFPAAEVKTRRELECPWPEEVEEQLEQYMEVHRSVLLDGGKTDALWVALRGAGMTRTVLAHRITKRTGDEFGTAINPHTFRHIATTTIATEDPEGVTGVAAVLGHADLRTSEKHYNRAKMVDAARTYQATLKDLRKGRGRTAAVGQQALPL